jgi:hypothetical protein
MPRRFRVGTGESQALEVDEALVNKEEETLTGEEQELAEDETEADELEADNTEADELVHLKGMTKSRLSR